MAELGALSSHYPAPARSPGEQARWLSDFADDLAEFADGEVRRACADWRRSEGRRFPTPGQLLTACRQVRSALQHAAAPRDRAEPYEPWKLSSGDVADMSFSQALRYHQAMATHYRAKAGPMWRNGRPAEPDELPESWRAWRAKAQDHEAEAGRLRTRLAEMA